MTGGKASEFRGRGLASGAWMGGRVRGRLKGHGVVRSGVNLDGVGVNPGESESSIFYYSGLSRHQRLGLQPMSLPVPI